MDYRRIITIEAGKRGGRPCIRGMRISSVYDVLGWLAAGKTDAQIVEEFPELTREDKPLRREVTSRTRAMPPRPGWQAESAEAKMPGRS